MNSAASGGRSVGTHDCRGSPAVRDTRVVKLYFAGPLFTTPERTWNAEVCAAPRAAGHEVFLPQEQEPGKDGPGVPPAPAARYCGWRPKGAGVCHEAPGHVQPSCQ
jgi:hypothetical protein